MPFSTNWSKPVNLIPFHVGLQSRFNSIFPVVGLSGSKWVLAGPVGRTHDGDGLCL